MGRPHGAELHNPDFMKLADAFGVVGMRAKEPTDVGRLVREAIDLNRPALIEVPVGRMPRPTFFRRGGPDEVPAVSEVHTSWCRYIGMAAPAPVERGPP